ncbi:MAG TPA: S46 family peptidase [Pyrinomonadaceae bacterium]|nr:S46 family peptidase [Pyrinomonadaceae bacterium]
MQRGTRRHDRYVRSTALALLMFIVIGLMPVWAFGDEGMFMPDKVAQLPWEKFKRRGVKILPTDIYNPAGVSLKDAIVIVGGGTGEFVSAEGLLLTNHHVAFDALVAASSQTNNYGASGFTALTRTDEMPAKGYTVTITQDLKDVTSEVLNGIPETSSPADRNRTIQTKLRDLEAAGTNEAEGVSVRVMAMNEGLYYYKFTYLELADVRIVYAPPKSIGYFGGDPDNFEWPRHCGDFTFMRAYVGPNGKPAEYSTANVPYKPKKFLSLSMGGIKEGDFAMVMGYPGSTRRYRESYSVAYNQDVAMPFSIDIYSRQIEALEEAGKKDAELRIKLQSTIFSLNNELKNLTGSVMSMRRANVVEKKQAQEAAFTKWVNEDPARKAKYGEVLPGLEKAYQGLTPMAAHDLLVPQLLNSSDLIAIASFAGRVAADKEKPEGERNPGLGERGVARVRSQISGILARRNMTVERDLLTYLLRRADELPANQKIEAIEKRFGQLKGEARRRAEEDFARELVDSKRYSTSESLSDLLNLSAIQLRDLHDPLLDFAADLSAEFARTQPRQQMFNAAVARWRPLLVRAMSEMSATKPYPDANRTLRFTYGEVKGYVPHDAALYLPFTTLSGVIDKDTGREPFDVPEKLKQLYRARDFGPYAINGGGDVPVDFLSTTDIIGGNSGSPIMNGRGHQVGIVFDGNFEGLGNDFFYNEPKGRTISVDIRYVLFLLDKFGGAGYLLKEMDIQDMPAKLRRAA